jgi:RNA polymerase sigma-70 factor (ECF subfamily)
VESGALEGLFRRYSRSVFRRASAILGNSDAAKDVTQEVFLRALNSGSSSQGRSELTSAASPIAWLYRVTTNLCLKLLRDSSRRRRILGAAAVPAGAPPPELPVDAALTLRALLRDIPDDLQEIAIYYFVDNMSQDEIAELTGMPRRTVGYRLEQFRSRASQASSNRELAS